MDPKWFTTPIRSYLRVTHALHAHSTLPEGRRKYFDRSRPYASRRTTNPTCTGYLTSSKSFTGVYWS